MKIALAQINPTVGDFLGNQARILDYTVRALRQRADLVVFPELCICGYPPQDLLEKPQFLVDCNHAVEEIAEETASSGISILLGVPTAAPVSSGKRLHNSALLIRNGKVEFAQQKMLLPFYDVFDEQRYFSPSNGQKLFTVNGEPIAITICEDAWNDKMFWKSRLYEHDPVDELIGQGSRLMINLSASPWWQGKLAIRQSMLKAVARRHKATVLMVNQVGGNDQLVFDGGSFALSPEGDVVAQAASFSEDLVVIDTAAMTGDRRATPSNELESTYNALVLGTRDYLRKCGFRKALIGLSGGIDSALVAAIAVDALGAENVLGVGMPSAYSSAGSVSDSKDLAERLGIRFEQIAIGSIFTSFHEALAPMFAGRPVDTTEENLQSRIRGGLLMAMSNKFGSLVLTTGNKSEMAVGYCTLYGDMCGGLAVIGDVVKTRVYELCDWVNREQERIPKSILTKPPSAELRPDQKDTDSLPPYSVLDPIVEAYVERYETAEHIAETQGAPLDLVKKMIQLIERSEYKRQQAAPVLKVTAKAFGNGRRFPIAARIQV